MAFRASFCDPFKADIMELEGIPEDKIIETFEKIPWADYLAKMEKASRNDIHYSPSLEIENRESRHGLSISAVGSPDDNEFYIFYKRPQVVLKKTLFGKKEKLVDNYLTDVTGQTKQDALDCLGALIRGDYKYLNDKIA